jgi:CBS domain containing-hemolysin-like protein
VQEIMTSRMNITALDIETPFDELLEQIKINGYSRIPIYEETIDKIEGILYVKDILPHLKEGNDFEWQKLLRPRNYVPQNKKIDKLLKEFQAKHVHMAIVVDEYGGTAGLVTMEDIIEEIVGEINDESDEEQERLFTKVDENTYLFEGKIAINDFCKVMKVDAELFDEVRGESQSLGGLMLEMFSRFPKLKEEKRFDKFLFTIVNSTPKQIKVIKVNILEQKDISSDA